MASGNSGSSAASFHVADYVHHVPGRLRLQFDRLRSDSVTSAELARRLLGIDGVEAIRTNHLIGSLTIEYDRSKLASDQLAHKLGERGIVVRDLGAPVAAGIKAGVPTAAGLMQTVVETAAKVLFEAAIRRAAIAIIL
jgi:hypothetical protein